MGKTKELLGTVISNKMQKTIVVKAMRLTKHPKYAKIIRKYAKFKVHDEKGIAKPGDTVSVLETRPLSKDKHFRLVSIVKKAQTPQRELKEEIK